MTDPALDLIIEDMPPPPVFRARGALFKRLQQSHTKRMSALGLG